jgi:hypothetical protein
MRKGNDAALASSAQLGNSATRSVTDRSSVATSNLAGSRHAKWHDGAGAATPDGWATSTLPSRGHSLGEYGALSGASERLQSEQVQVGCNAFVCPNSALTSCAQWQGQGRSSRMERNQCILRPLKSELASIVSSDWGQSRRECGSCRRYLFTILRGRNRPAWLPYFPERNIRSPLAMTMNSLSSWPTTATGNVNSPATAPMTKTPITSADKTRFCCTMARLRRASSIA